MVIAAANNGRTTAGFFFWEDNSVAANPSLTFPFEATKLVSEGWPTQAEPLEGDRFATLAQFFLKIADGVRRMSIPVKIGIVSALFALVIGIRVFTWNRSTSQAKIPDSPGLGLQVKRDGTKFVVAWNPSAPLVANAKDANLVIWDTSREAWDGSSEPLYMPLTSAQLRSGSVTYTSFAFTEKVKFRLDMTSKSGDAASESMVSVSPLAIANPASSTTLPAAAPAAGSSRAPTTPAAAENLPPYEPRHSAAGNEPRVPLARSPRAPNREFVLPKSVHAASAVRESVMPEPPNLIVEVISGTRFDAGFNPNAGPVPGPPAAQSKLDPGTTVASPNGRSNEGVVTITSEPSGALVEINAIPAGVTPITLQISPLGLGFTVTVTKSGFMKWTVQSFSTAQPYSLHAQLRQIPK